MKAIVLAAGLGTRAWPFCGVRQKVTLPVFNVPIVRRLVLQLRDLGVQNISVVIGHRHEAVQQCLSDIPNLRWVAQAEPDGTASAALCALDATSQDDVLVCHGDIVTTREKIASLISGYDEKKPEGALLVVRSLPGATTRVVVSTNRDGIVEDIAETEKSILPSFGGMIVIRESSLHQHLARYVYEHPGAELWQCLRSTASKHMKFVTVASRDFLVDVDKPWQLAEANYRAAEHAFENLIESQIHQSASIDDSAYIASDARIMVGPGARIGRRCDVQGNAIIQAGAILENGVITRDNVTIGKNAFCENHCGFGRWAVVGPHCTFSNFSMFIGVAFDHVSVRHEAQLCAILGSHVNIAGSVMTANYRFDHGKQSQRVGGRREHPPHFGEVTYIGDYSQIGNGVLFNPGMKVGYHACVGLGTIVTKDIPEFTRTTVRQEVFQRPWKPPIFSEDVRRTMEATEAPCSFEDVHF